MSLDYKALLILLCCLGALYWFFPTRGQRPTLLLPSIRLFDGRSKTVLERFLFLPRALFLAGLAGLGLAFLDPHLLVQDATPDLPPHEGLALYLVLDRSGSMATIVDQDSKTGHWEAVTRFHRLQQAATLLIQGLPQDLIGVMSFSRAVQVISPLTLDHKLLIDKINQLNVVKDPAQDGTSIGYAIYKTAHLIAASKAFSSDGPYKILSAFMIIITDGFQDPSRLDKGNRLRSIELEEAAAFAKEKNIKVFIVNIDPKFKEAQFDPNRHQMERIAAATGGKLIVIDNLTQLETVLKAVPEEEKNRIYPEGQLSTATRVPFYPYIIGISLILLGGGRFLNETFFRRAL